MTLQPGTSVIAVVTSDAFLKAVQKQADEAELRASVASLGYEISAKLAEGKNVALGILLTEEGMAVKEVAADDEVVEVIGAVATEEGVIGGAAVATEEGVAYEVAATTEDAAVVEKGVVTEEGAVVAGAAATEDEAVAGAAVVVPEEEEEDKEGE